MAETIDQWSGLDYKVDKLPEAPGWVPTDKDARRIAFYNGVAHYIECLARDTLTDDADNPEKADEWREFGDPAIIVQRIASAVIGDDPGIRVIGADTPLPDRPPLDDAPELLIPEGEGADPVVAQVLQTEFEAVLRVWQENSEQIMEEWEAALIERPLLQARQDYLLQWADAEQFWAKVHENEQEQIVPFGDGVYVLGWNARSLRPGMNIYKPAGYFPDLNTAEPGSFPHVVRLAYAFQEVDDQGEEFDLIRIVKYELIPIEEAPPEAQGPFDYRPEGYESTHVCLVTDAVYEEGNLEDGIAIPGATVFRYTQVPGEGEGELIDLQDYPTGLDFIPVVHIPNTLASLSHFGRSVLARLFQLFDEIAATDADESRATRWAGRPVLAASGFPGDASSIDLSPGKAAKLPQGGRLDHVDMARHLAAIMERNKGLGDRLSVNGNVPAGLIGKVDASEVPSGSALTISFTPFEQLVLSLRMARERKYRLILEMVQRIAIANDDEQLGGDTTVYPAELFFGSFMPEDLASAVEVISRLETSRSASAETRVLMALEAGVPIADIEAEVAAIRLEDAATAEAITQALENPEFAARYMGIKDWKPAPLPGVGEAPDLDAPSAVPAGAQV